MENKKVSFIKLFWQLLPEIWILQTISFLMLGIGNALINQLANLLLQAKGGAFTTANFKELLTSWQGILILILGIVVLLAYVTVELFSMIFLFDDALKGRQKKIFRQVFYSIGRAFKALPRFFRPGGILVLFYILVAFPLLGIHLFLSVNQSLRIPNFIMNVIQASVFTTILYWVAIAVLIVTGILFVFTVYGVLIDGLKPGEAAKQSLQLIRKNKKAYLLSLLKIVVFSLLIIGGSWLLFRGIPPFMYATISSGTIDRGNAAQLVGYHLGIFLFITVGTVLYTIVMRLVTSGILLQMARIYDDFKKEEVTKSFFPRTGWRRWLPLAATLLFMFAVLIGISFLFAMSYDEFIYRDRSPRIVAHRTGGKLASENSVEGIEQAVLYNCEGCETDIQRTKDGYYIINHDDSFKRLTGDARKPSDMTLAEIKELRIKDTTGSGALLEVPTLEDLLDASAGKVKLYIELKGSTADRQMVDDVVSLIKEKYKVEDVALISLNYDVIDYAESAYPEFETGVLVFQGYGDVEKLNCDMIMMEEGMLNENRIQHIQETGKLAFAWTVNNHSDLERAISLGADGIITDVVPLANQVLEEVEQRSDYEEIDAFLTYQLNL